MPVLRGERTGKNSFPLLFHKGNRGIFFLRSGRWLFEILLRLSMAGGSPAEQFSKLLDHGKGWDNPFLAMTSRFYTGRRYLLTL